MWENGLGKKEEEVENSVHSCIHRGGVIVVGSNRVKSQSWCVLEVSRIQFNEQLVYLAEHPGTRKAR